MNDNDSIVNQTTPLNPATKSAKGEVRPLKDALLRLSVSPIKADREAISRLERETGKDILGIIRELDSADLTLKAIEDKVFQIKPDTKAHWVGIFLRIAGRNCRTFYGVAATIASSDRIGNYTRNLSTISTPLTIPSLFSSQKIFCLFNKYPCICDRSFSLSASYRRSFIVVPKFYHSSY